jgi:hypothetical protein
MKGKQVQVAKDNKEFGETCFKPVLHQICYHKGIRFGWFQRGLASEGNPKMKVWGAVQYRDASMSSGCLKCPWGPERNEIS